jgi:hypothetical protein
VKNFSDKLSVDCQREKKNDDGNLTSLPDSAFSVHPEKSVAKIPTNHLEKVSETMLWEVNYFAETTRRVGEKINSVPEKHSRNFSIKIEFSKKKEKKTFPKNIFGQEKLLKHHQVIPHEL